MRPFVFLTGACLLPFSVFPQAASDYAVQTWATIQTNPAQITVRWKPATATSFDVHRKTQDANSWTLLSNVNGTDSFYIDNTVAAGTVYEYRVIKYGTPAAYGYVLAGIEIPMVESRGTLLLVIDTTYYADLQVEIERFKMDIVGDGWTLKPILVDRNDSVPNVKARIVSEHANHDDVEAVLLLGRVPVPYSGNMAPDGHTPDHQGAWPADVFYGELDGNWTDNIVNTTGATGTRNDNVPGDGKFDQNNIPSDIDLQVGRIDMANLPVFALGEKDLLKRYLDKDHAFRHKHFAADPLALIDDNFGAFGGEAFASNAWRSFPALVGPDNIVASDYRTTLNTKSHMWSYGCGAGSYTSCSGIGNSTNLSTDSLQTIFTMLFGSYFGDWDSPNNNFLRTAIAQGQTLTNSWTGRPYWQYHHMALGENIGYSSRRSQNNANNVPYYAGPVSFLTRYAHAALMGDLTLRMHIIDPPKLLSVNSGNNMAFLNWTPSNDNIMGYHVFRSTDKYGPYELITSEVVADTFWTDSCLVAEGTFHYLVKAMRLETSPSGSYYNLSQGAYGWGVSQEDISVVASFSVDVTNYTVTLNNQSSNATSYSWDFQDGNVSSDENPTHVYTVNGTYDVTLIASTDCDADTFVLTVSVPGVGIGLDSPTKLAIVYPNPGNDHVVLKRTVAGAAELSIFESSGRLVLSTTLTGSQESVPIPAHWPAGLYRLQLRFASGQSEGLSWMKF